MACQKFLSRHQLWTFLLLVLCWSLAVVSAPTASQSVELPSEEQRDLALKAALPKLAVRAVPKYVEEENDIVKRQAGLAWGPIYISNLKLYLTNPHNGYAGPKFPSANHVNFHVDQELPGPRKTYKSILNAHIVKYTRGDSSCLYVWDSVSGEVVFDKCFDDFTDAIGEGVQAIKDFVEQVLEAADVVASIVIIGALVVALAAAIASLAAVALA